MIVSGDYDRLQQIFWNLLSNAIKFTPQGGSVEIRLDQITISNPDLNNSKRLQEQGSRVKEITPVILSTEGSHYQQLPLRRYAQIQVIDNGVGISADFLPYVFDRFRQADSSSTRSYGGLGLGLSLVRHLVELHGGTVDVKSSGLNQGSTFTINLPLLEESTNAHKQESTAAAETSACLPLHSSLSLPELRNVRVLVVDDEIDSRKFMRTVLEECQAEVTAVASVSEALRILNRWQADVLISDIGMPQEDGYSLIRQVRSLPPDQGGNIPAAALTAYAGTEDRMRAIQSGFQLHLPKPIEPAELAIVVASLVKLN